MSYTPFPKIHCKKCVYYWIGLEGCRERQTKGECDKDCPFFVHINSPQGNLMLCEYKTQMEKRANE